MSAHEFRDDDAGYLAWLAAHPDGYLFNILRSHNPANARVHRAGCRTISGQNPIGGVWTTGAYVKVCAEHLAELDQWAIDEVGEPISPCGICQSGCTAQAISTTRAKRAVVGARPEGRSEVHGPDEGNAVVAAWADAYIRFERRPVWQEDLRNAIRTCCRRLEPSVDQVLHATFFGEKLQNADVENLALYYIDTFKTAGRNGIRFEHGAAVPPAPNRDEYPFCYRYALAPRSGAFIHWRQERTLASFDWTDLGSFVGGKQLAQVWLALARERAQVAVFEQPCAPETPFAVRVQVRPPHGRHPVWGGLVKAIFDGVICAFQAHTDTAVLPDVVSRLATVLPADPVEIKEHLLDQRHCVLGAVQKLVSPYRRGVKWDPADHLCVAGELLPAEPVDERWAIRGEIVELSRSRRESAATADVEVMGRAMNDRP